MNAETSSFWKTQRGLVWSNPRAGDSACIRAALLHRRFGQLLEIAVEFGVDRLRQEWAALQSEPTREVHRARRPTERILRHIQEGFTRAAAGLRPRLHTILTGRYCTPTR